MKEGDLCNDNDVGIICSRYYCVLIRRDGIVGKACLLGVPDRSSLAFVQFHMAAEAAAQP